VLDYDGRELSFLYSSTQKEIISFLSPDAPETAEWRRGPAAPKPPVRRRREGVRW
jgi:hypothetical protein